LIQTSDSMKELTIVYQSYIPADLITGFTELVQPLEVEKKEVKSGSWNHWDAANIYDIIIYIHQHPTEFIVGIAGGIIGNAIWAGIKFLWTGNSAGKQKGISLKISDKTRGIEIVFKGKANEKQFDNIIENLKEFINSEKVNNAFYDSDNIPEDSKKPEIRLIYNQENKTWEPENFGEKRRKMDELRKQAQRKFRS